jgi:competence protein ComEA
MLHPSRSIPSRFAITLALAAVVLGALPFLAAAAGPVAAGQVNINSASVEQLALLPRIGPSVAQKILEFRQENGPFKSAADLMLVRGIGEKTFEQLKPYLAVSGETTLTHKVSTRSARGDAAQK